MMKKENFYKVAENEGLLDYVNDKKKEFLEQYLDFSFQEYLEDVYHYSIEYDDINNLEFIACQMIYEFNCFLLDDERFLESTIISHFKESKKREIFGLSLTIASSLKGEKATTWWYALVIHPERYRFDIAIHECRCKHAVLDSEFVGKPLSYLVEHLRKENRI